MRHDLLFAAADAGVDGHQPALFDIELLCLIHHPLMMAMATQGIALVLILQRGPAKRNNLSHERSRIPLEQRTLYGGIPGSNAPAARTGTHLH